MYRPKAPAERHIVDKISPRWGSFKMGKLFSINISSRWDFLKTIHINLKMIISNNDFIHLVYCKGDKYRNSIERKIFPFKKFSYI
jgi:hypothetical protein